MVQFAASHYVYNYIYIHTHTHTQIYIYIIIYIYISEGANKNGWNYESQLYGKPWVGTPIL